MTNICPIKRPGHACTLHRNSCAHASARARGQHSPGRTHARALGLSLCTPGATKISHIASQQQSTHAAPLSSTSDTRHSRVVVKARLECSAQACTIRGTERFVLSFHGHLCQARPDFIVIFFRVAAEPVSEEKKLGASPQTPRSLRGFFLLEGSEGLCWAPSPSTFHKKIAAFHKKTKDRCVCARLCRCVSFLLNLGKPVSD